MHTASRNAKGRRSLRPEAIFNPDMKHHGLKNPDGPHAGDMPNFTVAADGTAKATVVAPGVTMGDDPHSIFTQWRNGARDSREGGRHEERSGRQCRATRIACGVIIK